MKFLFTEVMGLFVTRPESLSDLIAILMDWRCYNRYIKRLVISCTKGNRYCHLPAETARKTDKVLRPREWNAVTLLPSCLLPAFGTGLLQLFLSGLGGFPVFISVLAVQHLPTATNERYYSTSFSCKHNWLLQLACSRLQPHLDSVHVKDPHIRDFNTRWRASQPYALTALSEGRGPPYTWEQKVYTYKQTQNHFLMPGVKPRSSSL